MKHAAFQLVGAQREPFKAFGNREYRCLDVWITYAVGIAPTKLPHIERLVRRGARVTVVLDNVEAASNVAAYCHDHALTLPWTKSRTYKRGSNPRPAWLEEVCAADNAMVKIGDDAYFLSHDGYLMPVRKDQAPPDTRYFKKK